jgi:uncharacterized protein
VSNRLSSAPEAIAPEPDAVSVRLITLGRMLRARGVAIGSGQILRAHSALQVVDPTSSKQCYAALRGVLCSRREDLGPFDAAFRECFADGLFEPPPREAPGETLLEGVGVGMPATGDEGKAQTPGEGSDDTADLPVWSPAEILRHKDFADYTVADEQAALPEIRRLACAVPHRRSRRLRGCRKGRTRLQMRDTVRAAMRHGGEVMSLEWQHHSTAPRPLVLLCDVSASMAPYARTLLHYLHEAVLHGRRVEAFVFGTRLTRVTALMGSPSYAAAMARVSEQATDLGAGTRIGESIGQLNRRWGSRVGRGSIVIVLSDGWDCGDTAVLEVEMARLRRCSHHLVWLNPLRARPGFEPLTRGMRAALPSTDIFESGNSLEALQKLNDILEAA